MDIGQGDITELAVKMLFNEKADDDYYIDFDITHLMVVIDIH